MPASGIRRNPFYLLLFFVAAGNAQVVYTLPKAPVTILRGTVNGLTPQGRAAVPRQFELRSESPRFLELFPAGATLEKFAGGFGFTEGPVWDPR
jgi:hypothetical protein